MKPRRAGPTTGRLVLLLLLLLAPPIAAPAAAGVPSGHPEPAPPAHPEAAGVGVQRTMTLLASSTPEKRNKVRILFYGQSITEADWTKAVAETLRKRFPHADLEIENRAIGGFASPMLARTAEQDAYPFSPDLMIFHVYGGNKEYEQIIRNVRSRTSAEVLMQTDHAASWPVPLADAGGDEGTRWTALMNERYLPEIAKKYGCGLVDVRGDWVATLRANRLEPRALLKDDIHLNDLGNSLMAELVGRYLVHRPDLPTDSWKSLAATFEVGRDVRPQGPDGRLVLEFEGSRVDAIPARAARGGDAGWEVRVDGRSPSRFPGAYRVTRPSPGPWSPLTVTLVGRDADPVVEDWTLTITGVGPGSETWTFDVEGSVTGPDGSGSSAEAFVSNSGRVRIGADSWFRHGEVPVGHAITWSVLPMFVETYRPPGAIAPGAEAATTLVQGLPNGRHRLELVPGPGVPTPIRALRVHRPAVAPSAIEGLGGWPIVVPSAVLAAVLGSFAARAIVRRRVGARVA